MVVAKAYECSLKGVERVAFNLFRVYSGTDDPGCEFEFHSHGRKSQWIRLARHIMGLPQPAEPKNRSK
nr:hypothetical protein Hi04_10k_c3780_00003 [uncultured bacterium]